MVTKAVEDSTEKPKIKLIKVNTRHSLRKKVAYPSINTRKDGKKGVNAEFVSPEKVGGGDKTNTVLVKFQAFQHLLQEFVDNKFTTLGVEGKVILSWLNRLELMRS